MFKVTQKMKRSFNLSSEPDIFLYRLIQQVHNCHPGTTPSSYATASPTAKEKNTEKIHNKNQNKKRSVDFDLNLHHCDV
jgi:hypothetical protein